LIINSGGKMSHVVSAYLAGNPVAPIDPEVALHALTHSGAAVIFLNDERRITFFNQASEQLLGIRHADAIGADFFAILNATFSRLLRDHPIPAFFADDEEGKSTIASDVEIVRNDGTRFWGNITVTRRVYMAKQYYTVVLSDISKRQKMEDDILNKNAQIGKLNAQMEKFLYSTSHDLRSPLTSILGLINLLRMESVDEKVLEYILKIESSTMKLDRIIRNIMNFSRATYQRRRSEKIDVEQVANRVLKAHRGDSNYSRIRFDVVSDPASPFYSDPERVEIILNNIIANAIHFFDENKVRSFVRVNISLQPTEALVEIIDNGIGIGKQHHDQIFTMFYKASLNSSGAGLGLYIVKESLEQLKGTITMESELGFGSVFRIRIPNDQKNQLIGRKMKPQQH
jgi:PAS domain S-box-containing protein